MFEYECKYINTKSKEIILLQLSMLFWVAAWFCIVICVTTLNQTLFTTLKCPYPVSITFVGFNDRVSPIDPYALLLYVHQYDEESYTFLLQRSLSS